jgi:cell division protein ZipA
LGELRLVLLGICLLLLGGIWWWSVRGSRQARGASELRESTVAAGSANPHPAAAPAALHEVVEGREWGVSPLEPLSIKTADFDRVPILDMPMLAETETLDESGEFVDISIDRERDFEPPADDHLNIVPAQAAPVTAAESRTDDSGRLATPPPRNSNASERQKIVSLRVCAVGDARWPGTRLMAALEAQGLAYGRYQVYHRNHADGRSLFCVASLVEPGIFDGARMPQQEFRGISMFAVLPGPGDPLQTIDAMLAAAKGLAEDLTGMVEDMKGMPLSPPRAAALREEVAHFRAQLA